MFFLQRLEHVIVGNNTIAITNGGYYKSVLIRSHYHTCKQTITNQINILL